MQLRLTIRLKINSDDKRKSTTIFLVSAYAPIGSTTSDIRKEYESNMQQCIAACGRNEILVIGTDVNASVGTRDKQNNSYAPGRDQVRGNFGINH